MSRELLKRKDAIMEGDVEEVIEECHEKGVNLESIVDDLVESYEGTSQICNIMFAMLEELGDPAPSKRKRKKKELENEESSSSSKPYYNGKKAAESAVEEAYTQILLKQFKPEVADKLLNEGKEEIEWLSDMILHKSWRETFYKLMENYENSDLLKFVVKLISDAGYRNEMTTVNCASQQLNVFSRVLIGSIDEVLVHLKNCGVNSNDYVNAIDKLKRICQQGMHTYLYAVALLTTTAESEGGWIAAACEFIHDELRAGIGKARIYDTSVLRLRLTNESSGWKFSSSILSLATKAKIANLDISVIYEQFITSPPAPIEVIRDPIVLNYLIGSLFDSEGVIVKDDEMKIKHIYLLAYASATVVDKETGEHDVSELEECRAEIETVLGYLDCEDCLTLLFPHFLEICETQVIACGMLHYCRTFLMQDNVAAKGNETINSTYVILDNIATQHVHLRSEVLEVFCDVFEKLGNEQTMAELIIERQRSVIDRFVHLLSIGEVLSVLDRIKSMVVEDSIDSSLVRYFILEVLDMITPPYSLEFSKSFLVLLTNEDVFDKEQLAKHPTASDFIKYCGNV